MIGHLKTIEEVIKFRKSFFDIPFVVFGFELDIEEDCSFF